MKLPRGSEYLHDDLTIWHHHADSPEQGFQVLWQLHSPGIPWVHGDEKANPRVQTHLAAVCEEEQGLPLPNGAQNAVHLSTKVDSQHLEHYLLMHPCSKYKIECFHC